MSQTKVKKLTPAQEAQIPVYRDKWRAIALSTGPIDRSQATETITLAYRAMDGAPLRYGKPAPEIIFCDRPYQAANTILNRADKPRTHLRSQLESKLRCEVEKQLLACLRGQLESQLKRQLQNQLENELYTQLQSQLWSPLREHLAMEIASKLPIDLSGQRARYLQYAHLNKQLDNCIQPELWAGGGSLLDFCISVLNCAHSYGNIWTIFQSLVKTCGWIFPYDKVCVVCEKPIVLSADSNRRLHAEAAPAVQFAGGFAIYAYHGAILPEWYGRLHPREWQSKWLLKEHNAEVRRALIQGIGCDRICQELAATELDTWQEYTLLKMDFEDDFDADGMPLPVFLLKMTCPSTGFVHALRVPPNVRSAREAIRWVNWDIEPEEFSMQT